MSRRGTFGFLNCINTVYYRLLCLGFSFFPSQVYIVRVRTPSCSDCLLTWAFSTITGHHNQQHPARLFSSTHFNPRTRRARTLGETILRWLHIVS